jgi:hypothetical protein
MSETMATKIRPQGFLLAHIHCIEHFMCMTQEPPNGSREQNRAEHPWRLTSRAQQLETKSDDKPATEEEIKAGNTSGAAANKIGNQGTFV